RPGGAVLAADKVLGTRDRLRRVGFVEDHEPRLTFQRDVASTASEASIAEPLRHMLAVVPLVEVLEMVHGDVPPIAEQTLSCQRHDVLFSLLYGYCQSDSLASNASRNPSPTKFSASTDRKIAIPGKMLIHQVSQYCIAVD